MKYRIERMYQINTTLNHIFFVVGGVGDGGGRPFSFHDDEEEEEEDVSPCGMRV